MPGTFFKDSLPGKHRATWGPFALLFVCIFVNSLTRSTTHASPTQTAPTQTASPENLESFFPSLQERVKKIPLLKGRTPLTPLSGLEAHFDIQSPGTLLVKRDDLSQDLLGGNKARKLEYLLGEAQTRGARSLITAGMWGSNHALATTVAGRKQGYRVHLHLGPQPVTENVKKKLLAFKALGADLHYHSTSIGLGFAIAKAMLLDALSGGTVFHIPPGGSSPTGSLGYINGYLEMARQLEETQAPLPEQIVVPIGSMGTSAGLLVGSCLAGHFGKVQIIGVGVSDPFLSNEKQTRKSAKQLHQTLESWIGKEDRNRIPACDYMHSQDAFRFVSDQYQPGYGAASPQVLQSIELLKKTEQIQLDPTYSGKAMNWLIEEIARNQASGTPLKKTLFWLTYNSFDLQSVIQDHQWSHPEKPWLDLPSSFHEIFESGRENKKKESIED